MYFPETKQKNIHFPNCNFYFIKSAGSNYVECDSKANTLMAEYQAHYEPSWQLQRITNST